MDAKRLGCALLLAGMVAPLASRADRCPQGTRAVDGDEVAPDRPARQLWCELPNGHRQGLFIGYSPRGTGPAWVAEAGRYVDGNKVGAWLTYDRDRLASATFYERGVAEGEATTFHDDGSLRSSVLMHGGLKDGAFVEWDTSGAVVAGGQWKRGKRAGRWAFRSGEHWRNGAFIDGERSGLWTESLDEAGARRVSEGSYVHGRKEGRWKVWSDSLLPDADDAERRGSYHKGKKNGTWTSYAKEGGWKKLSVECRDGVPSGAITVWNAHGKKTLTGRYVDGNMEGRWTAWDDDGENPQSGGYHNGEFTGSGEEVDDTDFDRDDALTLSLGASRCMAEPGDDDPALPGDDP